jgi:hypothetical protein
MTVPRLRGSSWDPPDQPDQLVHLILAHEKYGGIWIHTIWNMVKYGEIWWNMVEYGGIWNMVEI